MDWERAISFIMTINIAKMHVWRELPYVLCGLGHPDDAVATGTNYIVAVASRKQSSRFQVRHDSSRIVMQLQVRGSGVRCSVPCLV